MSIELTHAAIEDAVEIAAVRNSAAEKLTRDFGKGFWSHATSEKGVAQGFTGSKLLVARIDSQIVAALRLTAKKPWAIDPAFFTPVETPIYLIDMAVLPNRQRQGVGRKLIEFARKVAWLWPADAIRLDAFDAAAGAGEFYLRCGFEPRGRATYRGTPLLYFESRQ